jgi:starch phosphorylase
VRVSTLRLWNAGSAIEIDLGAFNTGDYHRAARLQEPFENISWVLYPNDSTSRPRAAPAAGVLLRFAPRCRTSSPRTMRRAWHFEQPGRAGRDPSQRYAPGDQRRRADAPAVDVHGMPWADAWEHVPRIFSYTNHTLMPEALETWPVTLIQRVLPRHIDIIYRINQEFLDEVSCL